MLSQLCFPASAPMSRHSLSSSHSEFVRQVLGKTGVRRPSFFAASTSFATSTADDCVQFRDFERRESTDEVVAGDLQTVQVTKRGDRDGFGFEEFLGQGLQVLRGNCFDFFDQFVEVLEVIEVHFLPSQI